MGFGASAVLSGKLGAPDKVCITLTGDGGFSVNPTCLATAVEQDIPVRTGSNEQLLSVPLLV